MTWLVSTSLRLRVVVVALMAVVLIVGIRVIRETPLDVFPEFAPPYVEVQTEVPGLSTAEVEALVTVPIENALNGTPWVQTSRSKSVLGLSSVVLFFQEGTNLQAARQMVQERLALVAGALPSVAHSPVMLSPLSSTSRALKIGISSGTLSQMEMTTLAKWTIRPRLMSIAGVANVAIWGQRDRQLQVLVHPDRLRAHHVTLGQVQQAARDAVELAGGGFLDTPNQRLAVSHVSPIATAEDLAQVVVAYRNGAALRLGDVAQVTEGFPAPIGDAIINDGPGLLLIVEKQPWANTLEVTRNVEAALDALRPGLKDLQIDSTIFRPAGFIEQSIKNLNRALLVGCVLVVIVLVFFLYDWRTALISTLAIPCSLVLAALVLRYRGGTINTMVLAGLVIALGEVVDDAIIDVENIVRRLRLHRAAGGTQSAFQVVLNASVEVRSAVYYGSLIVALVLLPVFFLPGLSGKFFRPLALSYILAIMASLFVALTLTPALCLLILPRGKLRRTDAPLVAVLKRGYRAILPGLIRHPGVAISFLVCLIAASAVAVPFLGEEFLPRFKEQDFLMHFVEKPGTSVEAMDRITIRASKELRAIPGVKNFGSHIGRAEVADEVVGTNFTELWISVDPKVDYDATVAKIQEAVEGYPGLYRDVLTYLRERIKEVLTGTSATVVLRLYGPELEVLQQKAKEIAEAIGGIEGIADLHVQPLTMIPQVEVRFRPEAAAQFGLAPADVRRAATTLVKGTKVGEIYQGQKIFEVTVWGTPDVRRDIGALRALPIDTSTGGAVPLGDVADVRIAPTPSQITREASSRYIDVSCNVAGRDLGSVARAITAKVQTVDFDAGYHPEILGEYAERQASKNRLLGVAVLSALGIFLIVYADFSSVRLALLIMLSLPIALTGSIGAAWLAGGVLSLGSIVGFVTVLGIVARNGIMLISHYRHLETQEGMPFGEELIVRGALERLSPILMTTLAMALALVPIVVGGSRPGHEIENPMAIVILGGLFTSTLLNLLFLPALYHKFARAAPDQSSR
ncbi:MAG: efflux RND transporter permease subunit [Planctomycetes bacterium]|nr:efflux RND transporter permease subunit [Planctomycetota bacterium]